MTLQEALKINKRIAHCAVARTDPAVEYLGLPCVSLEQMHLATRLVLDAVLTKQIKPEQAPYICKTRLVKALYVLENVVPTYTVSLPLKGD